MKKIGKILQSFLLFLAAVLICVLSLWFVMRLSVSGRFALRAGKKASFEEPAPYDLIAVLGCGVYADGSLSPLLTFRMERTLELYENGAAPKICVTGDHREGEYDEVDHMAEYLLERGVPDGDIIRDYTGFSTYDSMRNLQKNAGHDKILLVTQTYHMYRALYVGRRLGLEVRGAAAGDWQMSAGTVYRHLREIPACVKDWLLCHGIDISRMTDKIRL